MQAAVAAAAAIVWQLRLGSKTLLDIFAAYSVRRFMPRTLQATETKDTVTVWHPEILDDEFMIAKPKKANGDLNFP